MKKMSKLMVAAAVSTALFGAGSAMAEETIKIGIAGPVTGPVAQYGDMEFTGGLMAVEQINAAGGIKGKNWKPSNMMMLAILNKRLRLLTRSSTMVLNMSSAICVQTALCHRQMFMKTKAF